MDVFKIINTLPLLVTSVLIRPLNTLKLCTDLNNIPHTHTNRRLNVPAWKTSVQPGLLTCVQYCLGQAECRTVSFNIELGRCDMHFQNDSVVEPLLVEKKYWVFTVVTDWTGPSIQKCETIFGKLPLNVDNRSSQTANNAEQQGLNCRNNTGYTLLDSSCLRFIREWMSWEKAEYVCKQQGGQLLTIKTERKLESVMKFVKSSNVPYVQQLWVGLLGERLNYKFKWTDGTDVTYTRWGKGEPNHVNVFRFNEICVIMYTSSGFVWNDVNCKEAYPFVCERESMA